jgi:tetratricopeptide (TPR) repeat protein
LNNLGYFLLRARRLAEAKPYYLRAVEIYEKRVAEFPTPTLRKEMAFPLMNLTFLAIKSGHHEEAERYARRTIDVLNKVESVFPGGVVAELGGRLHNNSAQVLAARGKTKEARRIYELAIAIEHEALRADPKDSRARDNLFSHCWNLCTLTYLEDPDLCGRFARSALDQRPPESKSDFFWYFLGWAEYHRGNWQACIQALEKVSDFAQKGNFFGAIAQWQLGDKAAARATFARADKELREREARSEDGNIPDLAVVRRQRAEAVALLGLSDPPAAEPKSPRRTNDGDR